MVPTRNRPRELHRLLSFLSYADNTHSVHVLDGSTREAQDQNSRMVGGFSFAKHESYDPELHLGLRCANALRKVSTPYVVFCGDDDFVFPDALTQCAKYLDQHADYSVVSGNVLSLTYLHDKPLLRYGVMLKNSFQFIGFTAHEHFLQRALYSFAYSYLGTPPLYYGLRRTDSTREAFYQMTGDLKYSGVELLSNSIALIRGKVAILEFPFGLRDYSCAAIREPERDNPGTYLSDDDMDFIKPILTSALATEEKLSHELAEKYVELYLTQWQPPDWVAPHLRAARIGFLEKAAMAIALLRSILTPDAIAARQSLPSGVMRALLRSQGEFIRRCMLEIRHR